MTFREALGVPFISSPGSIPRQSRIKTQFLILEQKYGATAAIALEALDARKLIETFRSALQTDTWNSLHQHDWQRVPWVSFQGDQPLAESPKFLKQLIERFNRRRRRSTCRVLISVYLRDFDPTKRSIKILGEEISSAIETWEWPWNSRHRRFRIFDANEGPRTVAQHVLFAEPSPTECLTDIGLSTSLRNGAFAEATYTQAIKQVEKILREGQPAVPLLRRLLEWSSEEGKLLYPNARGSLADTLLLPWRDRDPGDVVKDQVMQFLLRHLRDPRVAYGEWSVVSDDAKSIMRRWLTKEALEQFISVIDHFAVEHMWRFRKAFWMAYFERGDVTDAKVLFGPNALKYARQSFGSGQTFGMLDRPGIDPNHSVLLLRIGNLTIADWSHNGKCHIWRDGNRDAPSLWPNPPKKLYTSLELKKRSDNGGTAHVSSDTGNWQQKIADYIRRQTGVSMPFHKYMP